MSATLPVAEYRPSVTRSTPALGVEEPFIVEQQRATQSSPLLVHDDDASERRRAARSSADLKLGEKYESYDAGEILFHDADEETYDARPRQPKDLIRPPVVRQWLVNGKLYRERFQREQSRFELFFDLVFVAFMHVLSDAASETANGSSFLRFILTFYPAWSLWSEFRTFMNQSGTDDISVRINVLLLMAILVGYSANASAIQFGSSTDEVVAGPDAVNGTGAVTERLLRRAVEGGHIAGSAHTSDRALVASAAFFIVGRGSRIPLQLYYAWRLPHFAHAFRSQALLHTIIILICMPLLWVTKMRTIIILASFSMGMDLVGRFLPTILVFGWLDIFTAALRKSPEKLTKWKEKNNAPFDIDKPYQSTHYMPAINIEHHIERTVSFIVIVFGELVISVVYHATAATLGISRVYGRAVLGLILAFDLAWIYWEVQACRTYVHALRRHWLSAILWNQLHWPLSCSLILASAALSRLVLLEEEVTSGHRWFFGAGIGCGMIMLACIGAVHRNLEPPGLTRISRPTLLGFRVAVGITLCCLPLVKAHSLSGTVFLAIAAGLATLIVAIETYGQLHIAAAADAESDTHTVVEQQVDADAVLVEVPIGDHVEKDLEQGPQDEQDYVVVINEKREEDLNCKSWCEWVQMEKARRERVRAAVRAEAEGKALKRSALVSRRVRQWQHYQAQSKQVNAFAGAVGGS